jgi:hypothetical protein
VLLVDACGFLRSVLLPANLNRATAAWISGFRP